MQGPIGHHNMGLCLSCCRKERKSDLDLHLDLCDSSDSDATDQSPTSSPLPIRDSLTGLYLPPSQPDVPPIPVAMEPDAFIKHKLLGQGDVGKVYLVTEKSTNRLYAMKVMNKRDMIQRNKVKRVLTEREILSTARHPFIVTFYMSFQTETQLYFVMEYCAGGEFFRMLQHLPGKCLPEDHVKFYMGEVLLALEYLHVIGYIYRDLKSENILLHESGHIRLADFDLSKQTTSLKSPVVLRPSAMSYMKRKDGSGYALDTKVCVENLITNSFVGTEEYIAPEVITGYGHTFSVDWWTFGILMFEMCYGLTPFKGYDRVVTFSHILKGIFTFPEEPKISKSGKALMRSLLSLDPGKRLGSNHGASDIKGHPFFSDINWPMLQNMTPPIIPKVPVIITNDSEFVPDNQGLTKASGLETNKALRVISSQDLADGDPFKTFKE
eukprot:Ihof_evm1s1068 gene=Ihof_evmTU1s1068